MVLIIALLFFYLYIDFTAEKKSGNGKVIGKIVFKNNVVRRKFFTQVMWEEISRSVPLKNRDTIFTGKVSDAKIILNDGTVFEVDENSLVMVEIRDDNVKLNLENGRLSVTRKNKINGSTVIVHSGKKKVLLDKGSINVSKEINNDVQLFIKEGTADIEAFGKKKKGKVGDSISLSNQNIIVRKNYLKLVTPHDRARIVFLKTNQNIIFKWNKTKTRQYKNHKYLLEISKRRNFSTIFKKRIIVKTQDSINFNEGIYYWRVSLKAGNRLIKKSMTRRLSIIKDNPIRLFSPSNLSVVEYVSSLPSIHFSWDRNENSISYSLEIAKDKYFKKEYKSFGLNVTRIAYDLNKDRSKSKDKQTYFWRIKTRSSIPGYKGQTSKTSSFTISKKTGLPRPILNYPDDNSQVNIYNFKNNEQVFKWVNCNDCKKSKIIFSKNESFSNSYEYTTNYRFWVMKKPLTKGTYYWKVQGYTFSGKKTKYSDVRSIVLLDVSNLNLVAPYNKKSYEYYTVLERGIQFNWKKISDGQYLFEFSNDRNFKSIFYSKLTSNFKTNLYSAEPGTFYWRVSLLNGEKKKIAKSPVRMISVGNRLRSPLALYPKKNISIDMTNNNDLTLRWRRNAGAHYYALILYKLNGNKNTLSKKEIISTKTNKLYYKIRDLKKLSIGSFQWTLQAYRRDSFGKIICFSNKVLSNFIINLKKTKREVQIISPSVQEIER